MNEKKPVIETTPEFVREIYTRVEKNISIVRKRLGRPLTLAEKILFLPAFQPAHKNLQQYPLLPAKIRLDWVRRSIEGNPRFFCDDMEIQRGGVSYMVDSLEALKKRNPEGELALLVGQDALSLLWKWHRIEEFPGLCSRIIVASRQEDCLSLKKERASEKEKSLSWMDEISVYLQKMPLIDISSTLIRQKIKEGGSVRYLVPEVIREEMVREISL